jgi:hypothetical protein
VTEEGVCTPAEKRDALERALRSTVFARSEQLRAFLRFVCEAELEGTAAHLTEYVIGVGVLGRPQGYSPGEDSSVRTRAYELRQKLERLYAAELRDDPVHIVIPKGSYTPFFLKPPKPTGPPPAPVASPLPVEAPAGRPPGSNRQFNIRIAAGWLAAAALGAVAAWLVISPRPAKPEVDPIVQEAWQFLAKPNADVLLCAATPLNLVVGPEGRATFGSPSFPAPPETYPLFRQHRPLAPDAKLGLAFTDIMLGVGTMNAVVASVNTLRSLGASYQILPERVATVSALRGRNAILFGAPVDSEAISRTLQPVPLTVDYEPSVKEFIIRERTTGRMIMPKKDAGGDFVDVYGLVTVLNNRDSDRGRLGMIVFSGITSAGTQGAAEFFSSARGLRQLKTAFAKEGLKSFPIAYQVVVRCTFSNWLLLAYEYDSHKTLQRD